MTTNRLIEKFRDLKEDLDLVYVIPLIRHAQPDTDYLYNLYRSILASAHPSQPEIASLSVFSHYRFVWDQLLHRPIILHYHWLEFQDLKAATGMIWKVACLCLYKLLGGKLVWTIHNREPHQGRWPSLNYRLRKWMAHKADLLHVHCQTVIPDLSEFFEVSEKKFFVHPHPAFPAHSMNRDDAIDQLNAHYKLELDHRSQHFLIFGNIAHYKGIDPVIDIFSSLPSSNKLIIAGRVKKGNQLYYHQIKDQISSQNQIKLISRYIPEEHISWFFNSSDYVIYNHYQLISSGVIELARSYNKDIIAPRRGCLQEETQDSKLYLFDNFQEFQQIIHERAQP